MCSGCRRDARRSGTMLPSFNAPTLGLADPRAAGRDGAASVGLGPVTVSEAATTSVLLPACAGLESGGVPKCVYGYSYRNATRGTCLERAFNSGEEHVEHRKARTRVNAVPEIDREAGI